ncbi:MAG TPA: YceD family protein, partial [bacterium]|nr:YceD family protein [bacterium]
MLKVELRSLEREDLVLEEKDWAQALGIELTPELSREPLEIYCELSKNGDVVSAKGWVQGKMILECGRCLKGFESCFKSFFEVHYRPQCEETTAETEDELPEGQFEVVYFDGDILDIADQIRQTVLLSVPM